MAKNISRRNLIKKVGIGSSAIALSNFPGLLKAQNNEEIFEFISNASKPYKGVEVNFLAINSSQTKDIKPYIKEFE